jgi:glutamate transport system permease protein
MGETMDPMATEADQKELAQQLLILILGLLAWIIMTLAQQGIFDGRRWVIFTRTDVWNLLGNGLVSTLTAAAIAFPFGLMLCLLRISTSRFVSVPARIILDFVGGMPVVLMMLFVLLVFGTNFFTAVVIGLVLYNGAVFSEIIRAGIQSLPKGQREAGLAIGLTSFKSRMLIELPQAIRRMMPSLIAQLVVLLKDTSLGYIVAYGELLRAVQVINICVSRIAVWIEQHGSKKAAGGTAPASPAAAVREGASVAK